MNLKVTWKELGYACMLLLIIQGNLLLKLATILLLLVFSPYKLFPQKSKYPVFFYLYIITVIVLSFITVGWLNEFNYIFSLIFSLIIWFFCYFIFIYNDQYIDQHSIESLKKSVDVLFTLNTIVSLIQLTILMIEQRSFNPFGGTYKGATGDFIYGVFFNSSVNMIISTFFFFYYLYQRNKWRIFFSAIIAILTTYMSGLVLAVTAFVIILLFNPVIKFKYKLYGFIILVIAYFSFRAISPENIIYAERFIKKTLTVNPPRKLVSLKQTLKYSVSSIPHFTFGSGPGNFSSRTAFVFGGEYVSWLPQKMVYRSQAFEKNHFPLWNSVILSKPYQDGTANQPFSVYNQLIGEYGWIGVLAFLIFYAGYFFRYYYRLTYGKYLLVFLLLIFLMDYWFEYLSIIVLFEVLMLLELKMLRNK